jgi:hypothetical protein
MTGERSPGRDARREAGVGNAELILGINLYIRIAVPERMQPRKMDKTRQVKDASLWSIFRCRESRMQINFELAYHASVKTKSSMDYRSLVLKEPFTVSFSEVSSHDAPIAVMWTDGDGVEHYTRFHNGRHYAPVETEFGSDASTLATEMVSGNAAIRNFSVHVIPETDDRTIASNHPRIEHVRDGDRERAHAKVLEWAERCSVIDGTMFIECAESHYVPGSYGPEVSVCLPTDSGPSWDMPPYTATRHRWFYPSRYSLLDRESCLRDFEVAGRVTGQRDVVASPAIIVLHSLNPMHLRLPLHEAARHVLDAVGNRNLACVHPAVLAEVVKLGEILWERNTDDIDFDDLSDAIEHFRSVFDRFPPPQDKKIRIDLDVIDQAVRRWGDTEIFLQIATNPELKP